MLWSQILALMFISYETPRALFSSLIRIILICELDDNEDSNK